MYQIVIGSLNEPLVVDDKTGIDLTVSKCATTSCSPTMGPDGDMDGPGGSAVTGLDQTLKVELIAGNQKKTMALTPQYGKDGAYTAPFYPTVATSLAYHFTGNINGTPVDLTYTCIPEGSPTASDNTTPTTLSDSVTQMSVGGGFGCPIAKEDLGFPVPSASISALSQAAGSASTNADIGIAIAVVAVIMGAWALMKGRRS